MSTEAEQTDSLLHTCPRCGTLLDVSVVEPFTEVGCPSCGETMRVRTRFDHFELLEYLAAGGMGTVYKARDVNLNRILALKLLRNENSADAPPQTSRLATAREFFSMNSRRGST